jgi:molybdopterin converting factor small subunit
MIQVEVRLFATLRRHVPTLGMGEALMAEFAPGADLLDLFSHLGIPPDEVKQVFVNYRAVPKDYVLQNGDRVSLFPPIAGG